MEGHREDLSLAFEEVFKKNNNLVKIIEIALRSHYERTVQEEDGSAIVWLLGTQKDVSALVTGKGYAIQALISTIAIADKRVRRLIKEAIELSENEINRLN